MCIYNPGIWSYIYIYVCMYTYITPEIYHSKNDGLGNVFAFKHGCFKRGYFKEEGKYIIDIKHPNKKKGQNPNPTFLFGGGGPVEHMLSNWSEKKGTTHNAHRQHQLSIRNSSKLFAPLRRHPHSLHATQLPKLANSVAEAVGEGSLNRCFCCFLFFPNFDFLMETVIPPKSFFTRKNRTSEDFSTQKSSRIWTKFIRFLPWKHFSSEVLQNLQANQVTWKSSHFVILKPSTFRAHFMQTNSHQPEWFFFPKFCEVFRRFYLRLKKRSTQPTSRGRPFGQLFRHDLPNPFSAQQIGLFSVQTVGLLGTEKKQKLGLLPRNFSRKSWGLGNWKNPCEPPKKIVESLAFFWYFPDKKLRSHSCQAVHHTLGPWLKKTTGISWSFKPTISLHLSAPQKIYPSNKVF